MLLKSLELNNIRSYVKQKVEFSRGSILLAGDIGAGKSTLLLAIEFALFGSSRSDLPAQALLRKGAVQGSVKLVFKLHEKEYIITRGLKKEAKSIKQTAGSLIINGIKKELMPTELKAHILNILGYPQHHATKAKNQLFRYTVYTPQEQMKFILEEQESTRLDVLRELFNIDKYKTIRENVAYYLRELRLEKASKKGKLERKESILEQFASISEQLKQLKEQHILSEKEFTQAKSIREEQEKLVLLLEERQKKHQQAKEEHVKTKSQLTVKQEQNKTLMQKITSSRQRLESLQKTRLNATDLTTALTQLRKQQEQVISAIEQAKAQSKQVAQELEAITKAQTQHEANKKELLECKTKLEHAKKQSSIKQEQEQKSKTLNEHITELTQQKAKHNALLEQIGSKHQNIAHLSSCPTCLQEVSQEHKTKIEQQTSQEKQVHQEKIKICNQELNDKKKALENCLEQIKQITQIEKQAAALEIKCVTISKAITEFEQKIAQKEILEKEFELLKEKQTNPLKEKLSLKIVQLEEEHKAALIFEQEEKQQQELVKEQQTLTKELELSKQAFNKSFAALEQFPSQLQELTTQKELLKQKVAKQQQQAILLKEVTTKQTTLSVTFGQLTKEKAIIEQEEKELESLISRMHWLEKFFIPLTNTIEKHIFVRVYHQFNGLFQEWFTTLIEDPNITARLDESFTPIIEQNGYELSFTHLSGGEKTSTALAYRLALNQVINDVVHQIKTKDLLILDEPTDGFSHEQLNKVRDVLEKLKVAQMVIVSHEPKIESFVEQVIRVQKRDHESCVQ